MYGKGADWKADNAYRFIQKMILDNVLEEYLLCEPARTAYAVIHIGSNWPLQKVFINLLIKNNGNLLIHVYFLFQYSFLMVHTPFHVEDENFASLNFVHKGARKIWIL